MAELRTMPGKDIWLWGGGELLGSLAEAGLVDTVEVGVVPVLLGARRKIMATSLLAPSVSGARLASALFVSGG